MIQSLLLISLSLFDYIANIIAKMHTSQQLTASRHHYASVTKTAKKTTTVTDGNTTVVGHLTADSSPSLNKNTMLLLPFVVSKKQ